MTLTEFLLARIADDEERAQLVWSQYSDHAKAHPWEQWRLSWQDEYDLLCIEPPRALAECEAKRSIVEYAEGCSEIVALKGDQFAKGMHCASLHHLRRLALPYADHPDYQQEWQP